MCFAVIYVDLILCFYFSIYSYVFSLKYKNTE